MAECSIDGCDRKRAARGMCSMHYTRWRRHGDPGHTNHRDGCTISGCNREHYAHGHCEAHYARVRRLGDARAAIPVKDLFASPEEAFAACTERQGDCLIWTGDHSAYGYGRITVDGKRTGAHRYSWSRQHGQIPEGMYVDHICHNRACVNPEHLRLATAEQNTWNRSGAASHSSTGVRGVRRRGAGYAASLTYKGVRSHLGMFASIEEATIAVQNARSVHYGEYAGN